MRGPWRRLALAAAIVVTVGVSAASAQTVVVRHAPPGTTIELVQNTDLVATAKPDAKGTAVLATSKPIPEGKAGRDAHLYLETCDARLRVLMVERGQPAADPGAGCTRKQVVEWFVLRRVTTLVLDMSAATPTALLRQGAAPEEWLSDQVAGVPVKVSHQVQTGLMGFASAGYGSISETINVVCGYADTCN